MKCRIVKPQGMYYGEVFVTNTSVFGTTTGWFRVTQPCFTEWGAKRELKKWKKENLPEEFEM